jgi:hypothetical protein
MSRSVGDHHTSGSLSAAGLERGDLISGEHDALPVLRWRIEDRREARRRLESYFGVIRPAGSWLGPRDRPNAVGVEREEVIDAIAVRGLFGTVGVLEQVCELASSPVDDTVSQSDPVACDKGWHSGNDR